MRIRRLLTTALAGTLLGSGMLVGCADLDVTDPNRKSAESFWRTEQDANLGLTATYNALLRNGTFARWQAFANDIRSDIGTAEVSPWGDLANFNRFQLNDYNFEVNREIWIHNYELIGRANQVIANVPGITMDVTRRDRIVAEAKFLRALGYYNLVTLYENVPLITAPPTPDLRPAAAAPSATFAQIEKDLVEAAAVLPATNVAGSAGRPTRWAALSMLGRVRLQMAGVLDMQAKWAEALTPLNEVVTNGGFTLLTNYADNFVEARDFTNTESIFEVSMEDLFPQGVTGLSFPKMIGPCYRPGGSADFNPTFCDGRPTRSYFDQFRASRTTTGLVDPRLDATLLYNDPARATESIYGRTRGSFFVNVPGGQQEDTMIFFRKYGETYLNADQRWDNPINYKVIRFADVLLMQAEALNESGGTGAEVPLNRVRARANKAPVPALSREVMRDTILMERMFELGLESSRFNDLRRHDRLSPTLASRDRDFVNFVVGKSERLPIPTTERNRNGNLAQNPNW